MRPCCAAFDVSLSAHRTADRSPHCPHCWAGASAGANASYHYATKWDGVGGFYCVAPFGQCSKAPVVRCSFVDTHNWPFYYNYEQVPRTCCPCSRLPLLPPPPPPVICSGRPRPPLRRPHSSWPHLSGRVGMTDSPTPPPRYSLTTR